MLPITGLSRLLLKEKWSTVSILILTEIASVDTMDWIVESNIETSEILSLLEQKLNTLFTPVGIEFGYNPDTRSFEVTRNTCGVLLVPLEISILPY